MLRQVANLMESATDCGYSPTRHLASAIFPVSDSHKYVVMLTAYMDETGHSKDERQRFNGMAGLLAPTWAWEEFEPKWKQTLKEAITYLTHIAPDGHNLRDLKPYQIVSLLDMIDFYAGSFMDVMYRLRTLQEIAEREDGDLSPEDRSYIQLWMTTVEQTCERYEINVSGCIARIRTKVTAPDTGQTTLASLVLELRHRITDDLSARLFMFMPTVDAEYYRQSELFGPEVAERFPEANKEAQAAGNCYAAGNNTACVFHLMRAVELGARCMIKALRVKNILKHPVELSEWGDLIAAMEQGLKALAQGKRKSLKRTETYEYYSHAIAQFRNFKDAWRNNVSHTRKHYEHGQTKDIIDNTRQLMQHLATRLKE